MLEIKGLVKRYGAKAAVDHLDLTCENGEIFDFALTAEDMDRIAALNRHTPFYKVTPESLQRLATTKCNFEE